MESRYLKPGKQYISVWNKDNRVLQFLSSSVTNRSEEVITQLCLASVRHRLENAVLFWSSTYRINIDSLKKFIDKDEKKSNPDY